MKQNSLERLAINVMDGWLEYQARFTDLPGFQVCIRKKEQVIFSKAYGYANLKTKRLLTTDDLFHIASHSKTFTSCTILQLVERGQLTLQQAAINYLPELKTHKDKRFKQVTIRDLLSNRSGLFRDGVDCEFWDLHKPFPSKDQLLQEVLSSNLIFSLNENTKYSNMGFSLLGLILENALGIPFQKVVDFLIFKKLKGARLLTDYQEAYHGKFADGHSRALWEGKRLALQHAPARALASATGFCGNAEDTSLFFNTFLLGKGLVTKEIQRETLSLNWAVKNTSGERYGLGLLFNSFSDMELVGHSGSYPGFSTYTAHWTGTDYVLSFLLNTNAKIPLVSVRSIIQILQKIKETFTTEEAIQATIGGPFINKWGSLLCVLTKKKGLCFTLDNWAPCNEVLLLTSKDGENFVCEGQSGFHNIGEEITFKKGKDGNLLSLKWGSKTLLQENVFLKNLQATLL